MEGKYIPYSDGYCIVGFSYECPKCNHITYFKHCEDGCENCKFSEPYTDPDDWFEEYIQKNYLNKNKL